MVCAFKLQKGLIMEIDTHKPTKRERETVKWIINVLNSRDEDWEINSFIEELCRRFRICIDPFSKDNEFILVEDYFKKRDTFENENESIALYKKYSIKEDKDETT